MTDNNLTEVNEYESWGAGTLLATKKDLMFIVHSPDPWDFSSDRFKRVNIGESEKFILMLSATKEVDQDEYYVVFRVLHPVFGKAIVAFGEHHEDSAAERIQKHLERVVVDED